jgi:hypothetical protein
MAEMSQEEQFRNSKLIIDHSENKIRPPAGERI